MHILHYALIFKHILNMNSTNFPTGIVITFATRDIVSRDLKRILKKMLKRNRILFTYCSANRQEYGILLLF